VGEEEGLKSQNISGGMEPKKKVEKKSWGKGKFESVTREAGGGRETV